MSFAGNIPPFMRTALDLGYVTVNLLSVDTNGNLTTFAGYGGQLNGSIDGIRMQGTSEDENVASLDTWGANPVPSNFGAKYVITEILKFGTNQYLSIAPFQQAGFVGNIIAYNLLAQIWALKVQAQVLYIEFVYQRGNQQWDVIALVQDYDEDIRRVKSTGQLTIERIDTGGPYLSDGSTPNPLWPNPNYTILSS